MIFLPTLQDGHVDDLLSSQMATVISQVRNIVIESFVKFLSINLISITLSLKYL